MSDQVTNPFRNENLVSDDSYGDAARQGEQLRDSGVAVAEVGLNGTEAISVPAGAVGAIGTEGLNGCHATVLVVREADGGRTAAMSHFPPSGFLPTRYREVLGQAADDVAARGGAVESLVRVVNGGRQDTDTEAVAEAFPDTPVAAITYDVTAFRGEQLEKPEPVSCLAVVDNSSQDPTLRIVAGGHEMELPLGDKAPERDEAPAPDKPSVSTELVPVSHYRKAFNAVRGTRLEAHDELLSPEDAARINSHFDTEVYVGIHGTIPGKNDDPEDPKWVGKRPGQVDYEAAADVIAGMQRGDTLFVETTGYTAPDRMGAIQPEDVESLSWLLDSSLADYLQDAAVGTPAGQQAQLEEKRRILEARRAEHSIDTWTYAAGLAHLKGINVVYADFDRFDQEAAEAVAGKSLRDLMVSKDPADKALFRRVQSSRDRKSANILKDEALAQLPPVGSKPHDGRKPKLVVLYGREHKEGLERTFKDMNLDATVTQLKESTRVQRLLDYRRAQGNKRPEADNATIESIIPAIAATALSHVGVDKKPGAEKRGDTFRTTTISRAAGDLALRRSGRHNRFATARARNAETKDEVA